MTAQDEKTTITSDQEPTTQTVRGQMPEHLQGVELKDTFLPEAEDIETPEAKTEEKTETPEATETPTTTVKTEEAPKTPETETPTPTTVVEPTEQPKTAANEEIVDKTQPPKIYANKYKTVEELKHGLEEMGGDPTGIDDPNALEQAYLVAQKVYNKMIERNRKADEIVTPKEEPKQWQLSQEDADEMLKEVEWDKIENMGDVLKQLLPIMFNRMPKYLPQMYPQKEVVLPNDQELAAKVTSAQTNVDSLAFIEAKVPRLTSDQNFRNSFAQHLANGKKIGNYKGVMTRDDMVGAMKDFLAAAKAVADEASKLTEEQKQDKEAAATPDGGGDPASTEPVANPEEDVLTDILGAKVEHDTKFNFS